MPPAAPSVARSRGGRREGGKLGQRRRRWQRLGLPGLSMSQQPTLARRISLCLCLCVCAALGAAQSGSCRDKKNCKVVFSQQELRKRLTPLQYHVTQEKGTESAFEGEYTHHKDPGIYKCVVCGTPLFKSETKFDSGSAYIYWEYFMPDAGFIAVSRVDTVLSLRESSNSFVHCMDFSAILVEEA
nr:methionine-R-sulfoxide reductase B3 isoform X3 [Loxodonta africana]